MWAAALVRHRRLQARELGAHRAIDDQIDRWLAEAGGSETSYRATFDTPEGHVGVGVRVRRIGAGQFRYDYAVMNFDFARAQTDALTAEPNLRVLGNRGLSGLSVDLLNGAAMASSGFDDGNADAADDWSGAVDSGKWRWDAPGVAGATLDWGQLRFFQIDHQQQLAR